MPRRLWPVQRHLEEKPQRRHCRIDSRRLNAGLCQVQLERPQVFSGRSVREPAQESNKPLDGTDVRALRIGCEPAHAHVFEHALAQRADGLLAHWGLLS
jgi:hypothetical protein